MIESFEALLEKHVRRIAGHRPHLQYRIEEVDRYTRLLPTFRIALTVDGRRWHERTWAWSSAAVLDSRESVHAIFNLVTKLAEEALRPTFRICTRPRNPSGRRTFQKFRSAAA